MTSSKKLKVLVVDDTVVYRKAVSDVLAEIPGVEVIGVAHDGKIALEKIKNLQPDLITLDIEMPRLNGIQVLQELKKANAKTDAIILSTLIAEGSKMTIQCLELGAFDFILKPQSGSSLAESKKILKSLLTPRIHAYQEYRLKKKSSYRLSEGGLVNNKIAGRTVTAPSRPTQRTTGSKIVVIGISTGGPNALAALLPMLPSDINVPVLIVQHMPPVFTNSLANSLNKKTTLNVKEAVNGEPVSANTVYIAPGGRQMKLATSEDGRNQFLVITDDPPENGCKPSADYLFRSVANFYLNRATAVIMTGMGSDGCNGLETLKKRGAYIIGQDESSCVVYGMPKAAFEKGLVDKTLPLGDIAQEIISSVR